MSSDNSSNGGGGTRGRRSSFSQSTLSSVFQRGNSVSGPSTQPIPVPNDPQRRRLSITTLGLSGTTPSSSVPYGIRRGSVSTNSGSIDEDAIEDDDGASGSARTAPTPTAPFTRHMSFGAPSLRSRNDQQGYNWSEQLRSRAESSVTGARPSFSFASGSSSPPRAGAVAPHDRSKSVSEMPQPPVQAPTKPRQERPKPDAFQERILKGDFYMD